MITKEKTMGAATTSNSKRAIVVFDTRYGNTERIARSFETGLREAGVEAACIDAKQVDIESLRGYDLIAPCYA